MFITVFNPHKKKSCNTVNVIILPEMWKPRLRKVMQVLPVTQVVGSESGFHPTQSSHSSALSYNTPRKTMLAFTLESELHFSSLTLTSHHVSIAMSI